MGVQAVSPELCASLIPAILAHPSKAAQPIGFYHAPAMFNFDARYMELAAHPSLIAVAQRVIGGRTEPELNASSVPLENQLRLNDANGVVVEPGNRNGFWHCDGPTGQLHPSRIPPFATTLTVICERSTTEYMYRATLRQTPSHLMLARCRC